nr:uncharacterized protein LOC110551040 isoform X1 [Meriones unguiculatus]XP_021497059.1 uncharacterized protein LOC110551040 isoform X1 [Meriones unguiculatus]
MPSTRAASSLPALEPYFTSADFGRISNAAPLSSTGNRSRARMWRRCRRGQGEPPISFRSLRQQDKRCPLSQPRTTTTAHRRILLTTGNTMPRPPPREELYLLRPRLPGHNPAC